MDLQTLDTLDEVITALGGTDGLFDLLGAKPSTISMWKKAGNFPSNSYVVMTDALRQKGKTAPDLLWKMKMSAEVVQCS